MFLAELRASVRSCFESFLEKFSKTICVESIDGSTLVKYVFPKIQAMYPPPKVKEEYVFEPYIKQLLYEEMMNMGIEVPGLWYPSPRHANECDEVLKELRSKTFHPQRSVGWKEIKMQSIGSSELATALNRNPNRKLEDLLLEKCGLGREFTGNKYTEHGVRWEEIAKRWSGTKHKTTIHEFGSIVHNIIPFLSASPDGIMDDGKMIEIKCPFGRPLFGVIPEYYWYQVQHQLQVCQLYEGIYIECGISEITEAQFTAPFQPECFVLDSEPLPLIHPVFNMPCGLILKHEDPEGACTYLYPPSSIDSVQELLDWRDYRIECEPKWTSVYYNMVHYTESVILRDDAWFVLALEKCEDFWRRVEYHREHGFPEPAAGEGTTRKRKAASAVGRDALGKRKRAAEATTLSSSCSDIPAPSEIDCQ